jgi:hypothetical protein
MVQHTGAIIGPTFGMCGRWARSVPSTLRRNPLTRNVRGLPRTEGERIRPDLVPTPHQPPALAAFEDAGPTATSGVQRPFSIDGRLAVSGVSARPTGLGRRSSALPGHHVLRYLAGHLRDQQGTLVCTAFADVTTRVAAWLVRATKQSGPTIHLPGAQHGLAEAIDATRVSVNRTLKTLATEGLGNQAPW